MATSSSLSDLGSIYAGEVNSAAHLAVKSSSRRLAAMNGTGSKDIRSPQSRLEWCAGSAQPRLSAYIRLDLRLPRRKLGAMLGHLLLEALFGARLDLGAGLGKLPHALFAPRPFVGGA